MKYISFIGFILPIAGISVTLLSGGSYLMYVGLAMSILGAIIVTLTYRG